MSAVEAPLRQLRLTVLGPGHPFRGGIAVTTTALVRELRSRGHHVDYLTPRRQYPSWLYPGASDYDPEATEQLDGAVRCLDPFGPWSWPSLRRRLRRLESEAWIVPYWTWAWAPMWRTLLSGRRPKLIFVVHNLHDHDANPLQRLAAANTLQLAGGFLTHSSVLAGGLEVFEHRPNRVHSLPAPSPQLLPPRAVARERLELGRVRRLAVFLGLVRRYKGVEVLLDAVAGLPSSSNWTVVIAGEAWKGLDAELQAQADRLGLGDRVELRFAWVPEGDMASWLAAADLLVLPYLRASQSAVLPMALAHGVPVLATRVGGLAEVVEGSDAARLIEAEDPEALGAALVQLDDEGTLERMSIAAKALAAELCWSRYAQTLEDLIEEVELPALSS